MELHPDLVPLSALLGEVHATDTAKPVTRARRQITLAGDRLSYRFSMAAMGLDLQEHLVATLHRR